MGTLSVEIVGVIYTLLPGFLTAWIFYGLTAHPRPSPFERVVQALIFTGIVQATVLVIRKSCFFLGKIALLGTWTEDGSFVISIIVAGILGIIFSLFANQDWFHSFLRDHKWFSKFGGFTKRTSFPSEWYSSFNREKRYITLHLSGDRRLYGWPFEWPDHPDAGHFVIVEPEWILDDNRRVPVENVEQILIPAGDVEMVELLRFESEIPEGAKLDQAKGILVKLQQEGDRDVKQ